jgi:hypothetical protein
VHAVTLTVELDQFDIELGADGAHGVRAQVSIWSMNTGRR